MQIPNPSRARRWLPWLAIPLVLLMVATVSLSQAPPLGTNAMRQVTYQETEPKNEAPTLQNPADPIQPVGRRQRVYQQGMPMQHGR